MGVDTRTPGVAGRGYAWCVAHVYTGTRGRGAALVGGYAAEDRCLEKKEGCVSALQFEGEARRFYRLKVRKRVPTFAEACVKMRTEFNSITRQNRVRKYLQGLRLTAVMRERSCSVTEALEELRETITKFAQQGPRNYRSEEDKVDYLYRAVVCHEWASNSLSQPIASEPADFQQMFTDLDSAWLQQQEETEGRKRDGIPQARYRTEQGSRLPGFYYEGQVFYGKPRKFSSKSSVPRGYRPTNNFQSNTSRRMNENNPGQNGLDKFGKIRKCHNCGSEDHFIRDRNVKGKNMATNVANMLRQNGNGAKQILLRPMSTNRGCILQRRRP